MQNGKLSDGLVRLIDQVRNSRRKNGYELKVFDLRLECRDQRMSEYSDWLASELDSVEEEAACYGDETDLTQVLSGAAQPSAGRAHSWLHSPSPFAWT